MAAAIVLLAWFAAASAVAMVAVAGGRRAAGGDAGALDDRLARRDHRRGARDRDPGRDRPGAHAAARQPRLGGLAGAAVADRDRREPRRAAQQPGRPRRRPVRATRCCAITLLVVGGGRWPSATLLDGRCRRSRDLARASAGSRSSAPRSSRSSRIVAARPDRAVRRVQGRRRPAADARVRRRRPAARRRQRPLPVLGDRGRRLRERAGRAASARAATRPYWFEHREIADPGDPRALGRLRDPGRARPRSGSPLLVAFFAVAAVTGIRRAARGRPRWPRRRRRWRCSRSGFAAAAVDWTWDLPAVFGVDGGRRGAADRAGDPARRPTRARTRRPAARRAAGDGSPPGSRCCWSPGSRSAARGCCCCRRTRSSRAATQPRGGDLEAALDAANDAIDLQPWAAEPRTQLALVYEQAGDLDEAREAIAEAIERAPDDYRLHLLAARMAAERRRPGRRPPRSCSSAQRAQPARPGDREPRSTRR